MQVKNAVDKHQAANLNWCCTDSANKQEIWKQCGLRYFIYTVYYINYTTRCKVLVEKH